MFRFLTDRDWQTHRHYMVAVGHMQRRGRGKLLSEIVDRNCSGHQIPDIQYCSYLPDQGSSLHTPVWPETVSDAEDQRTEHSLATAPDAEPGSTVPSPYRPVGLYPQPSL